MAPNQSLIPINRGFRSVRHNFEIMQKTGLHLVFLAVCTRVFTAKQESC
jgi:hypothetical protein